MDGEGNSDKRTFRLTVLPHMSLYHITLRDEVRKDPEAKQRAFARVVEVSQIENVNEKRFDRYGIISGHMDDALIATVRQLPEVASVDADQMRVLR